MAGSKILRIKLPEKVDVRFLAFDWHSKFMNKVAFAIMIQHAKLVPKKIRKLIIGGDFIDFPEFFSKSPDYKRWVENKYGIEQYFLPAYEDEIDWGNKILDYLQSIFSEIIFLMGNHEDRVDNFRKADCPDAYKHNFIVEKSLKLKERGIKSVKYNEWIDIGQVALTHGVYHGVSAIKKHYEDANKTVIFGHVHKDEKKPFRDREGQHFSQSLPCLCNMNPEYMRKKPNDWSNGYGILRTEKSGAFNVSSYVLSKDRIILQDGTILTGDKEALKALDI